MKLPGLRLVLTAAGLSAALSLPFWPVLSGIAPVIVWSGALSIATIVLLATQVVPEYVTALGFMVIAAASGLARPEAVFGGFHASVVWLIFAGIVMGLALSHTGLAARVAAALLALKNLSYTQAVVAVLGVGLALGFVMPSTVARMVILMPIALALADHLGYGEGSRGRTGLALTVAFGAYMPTYSVLPANLPSVLVAGASETLFGVPITYAEYLVWNFPLFAVLKSAAIVALVLWWYREPPGKPAESGQRPLEQLGPAQKRLGVILLATVLLWGTDFAHHVPAGWVALAAAVLILLPRLRLVPDAPFSGKMDLSPMIYVVGVLGIGGILTESGAGTLLAQALIDWIGLAPGSAARSYAALAALASLSGQAMTLPGATAVLVPLAQQLADASGLPLKAVLMTLLLGMSTVWVPYVAPPLVVGLTLGRIPAATGIRFCVSLALVTALLFVPLNFFYWRLLGLL